MPERLLIADPDAILDHVFNTWPADPASISPERRAAYREALTPAVAAAMCGDYRASYHLDRRHDAADRLAGSRIQAPTLVITGVDETQLADAPVVWSEWAAERSGCRRTIVSDVDALTKRRRASFRPAPLPSRESAINRPWRATV
jgi:haloacetate dehalogenase